MFLRSRVIRWWSRPPSWWDQPPLDHQRPPWYWTLSPFSAIVLVSSTHVQRLWSSNKAQLCCGCGENLKDLHVCHHVSGIDDISWSQCVIAGQQHLFIMLLKARLMKMLTSSFVPLGVKWRKISLQRRLLFWNCLTSSAKGISCLRWCENVWLQRSALVGPGRGCRRSSRQPPECHAHYSINALYTTLVHTDIGGHISHTHTASHRWSRGLCERCCSQQFLGDGLLLGPGVASHQTLCFREELCVWPDNSALQTFNFSSVWVCESLFFVQEHHDERWPLVNFCRSGIPSCLWSPLFYFLWSNSIFFFTFFY